MKAILVFVAAFVAVVYADYPAAQPPYPPSGWKPARAFLLPVRAAQQTYGPPPPVYGPPPTTAAPEPEPTTVPTTTEAQTEAETTTEPATEAPAESGRADSSEPPLYYVLLPDGRLQGVSYTPGSPNLGYTAQLRIQDVQPVPPAPVYAYAGPLTRILRK